MFFKRPGKRGPLLPPGMPNPGRQVMAWSSGPIQAGHSAATQGMQSRYVVQGSTLFVHFWNGYQTPCSQWQEMHSLLCPLKRPPASMGKCTRRPVRDQESEWRVAQTREQNRSPRSQTQINKVRVCLRRPQGSWRAAAAAAGAQCGVPQVRVSQAPEVQGQIERLALLYCAVIVENLASKSEAEAAARG